MDVVRSPNARQLRMLLVFVHNHEKFFLIFLKVLGGPLSGYEHSEEEINLLALRGIYSYSLQPARDLITVLTELSYFQSQYCL